MTGVPRFTPFDPAKKSDWLLADINGITYTWAVAALVFMFAWMATGYKFPSLRVCLGVPAIFAFTLVFILRRNFTVIGSRREIRYICRWF